MPRTIILACAEYVVERVSSGPPPDAEYDPVREVFLADVPGAPVIVEHVKSVYTVPPAVRIERFRWNP